MHICSVISLPIIVASIINILSVLVVNKLSQGGEEDLVEMRTKVQTLAEDTAIALKKNVYKNYSQFIETAKEISSIL